MSVSGADLGNARGSIEIDVAKAIANIGQAQSALGNFGKSSVSAFGKVQDAGKLLAGFGGIVLGGLGIATKVAADFEHEMSAVGAVTGATGKTFDDLRAKALQLGKDTAFSASEAASAIEELGKAGVSTDNILKGAADGAVALAAAAGVSVPEAATVMANALNIFNLAGSQATHVADVFAAAANKSATDVSSLALGLAQSGAVAASFGISLEETVGQLAAFADQGLKGSDAGTSFKTMLISMLSPTKQQADQMAALGLSFFDAQGKFVGLDGVAGQLKDKLSGLTQEQRLTALAVLFGSDAVRAANILYGEGAQGVDDYTKAVNDAGAAQDAAKKRLDNLKGSLEQLKGSVETLAITIGSFFLPPLRKLVDGATAAVNALLGLPTPVQKIAVAVIALAGGVSALAGGFILLAPKIQAAIEALKTLGPFLAGIAPEVVVIVAALAALGIAYKTNLFGFRDAVGNVADAVGTTFGKIVAAAGPVKDVIGALFGTKFAGGGQFTSQTKAIQAAVVSLTKIFGLNSDQARSLQSALIDMAKPLRQLRNTYRDVTQSAGDFFKVLANPLNFAAMADLSTRFGRLFGKDTGRKLTTATVNLGRAFKTLGQSIKQATHFDIGQFLSLNGALGLLVRGVTDFTNFLRRDLIPALGPVLLAALTGATAGLTFLAAHMTTIVAVVGALARLVGTTLVAPFKVLAALLRGDFAGAVDAALAPLQTLLSAGADLVGWILNVGPPRVAVWAADLWSWLKSDGLPGFFTLVGDITNWALTVGAPGKVIAWAGDIWSWLQGQLFGAKGDGTDASLNGGLNLDSVVVNVLSWGKGKLVDIGGAVQGWLKDEKVTAALSLAGLTVDAAISVMSWLGDIGTKVGAWVKTSTVDAAISLSGLVIDVAFTAMSWAASALTKVGAWVKTATVDAALSLASLVIDVAFSAMSWAASALTKVGAWVKTASVDAAMSLTALTIDAAISAMSWLGDIGTKVGGWVKANAVPATMSLTALVVDVASGAISWAGFALATIITWVGDNTKITASMSDWTLTTFKPLINGWVSNPGQVSSDILAAMANPIVLLGDWTVSLLTPNVAFGTGFDLGVLARKITDFLGKVAVDLPWWAYLVIPAAIFFPEILLPALAVAIAAKIGVPKLLNWAGWAIEIGVAGTIGFIAGFDPVLGQAIVSALLTENIVVHNFVDWSLEVGIPGVANVTAAFGLAESVGLIILGKIGDVAVPLAEWSLNLGSPSIGVGAGIAAFGAGLSLVPSVVSWILEKLGVEVPSVPLPAWNLSIPTPGFSIGGAAGAAEAAGAGILPIAEWIAEKVIAVTKPQVDLSQGWDLVLSTPGFPGLDLATVEGWIEAAIKSLGTVEVPINFNIDLGLPGGLKSGSIAKQIKDQFGNVVDQGGGANAAQSITVAVTADTSAFDAAMISVSQSLDGFTTGSWVIPVGGDANAYYGVAISVSQSIHGLTDREWDVTLGLNDNASGPLADIAGTLNTLTSGTYTVTIGANTAPAAAAVQNIADQLPHSPAKKGPLSKPVSFKYIVDNLEASLAPAGRITEAAMARVSRALTNAGMLANPNGASAASGPAPRGGTTIIDNSRHEYMALSASDLQHLLAAADRGSAAADHIIELARRS